MNDTLRVGLAQLRPVLLHRDRTRARVIEWIEKAADDRCRLIAFGEALVPAYPFWLTLTDGARFESSLQKAIHARYLDQAVDIDGGDLDPVCAAARRCTAWVYLGVVERPRDRGAHSLYCTLVAIDDRGRIRSTHRKLVPTYEERLAWSPGDGHGLQIHELDAFRIGGLNCWENWMPLPRAALQAQGENVHLAVWPGNRRNTEALTPVLAREGRSYALSVSGLVHRDDLPEDIAGAADMGDAAGDWLADGGSCIAGPDGQWIVEPVTETETLVTADLDLERVREERQNFDPSGHYSRPDVLTLHVDRRRQRSVDYRDE